MLKSVRRAPFARRLLLSSGCTLVSSLCALLVGLALPAGAQTTPPAAGAFQPSSGDQATKSGFIVTSDGVRIHYIEAGQGRPVVFIPGWTMPAWIWQNQIDGLSKKYRVIAVDPRSQGDSDKPGYGSLPETRARDYKQLVDQLGLKQPVLVGWSMGCGELLSYIQQFGEDGIGGVVLVDGMIPPKQTPELITGLVDWTRQLQQDRRKQADVFVRFMFKKPQSEEYLQRVMQSVLEVPTDTMVALIYDMLDANDFSGAFAKINRPIIFTYEPAMQADADYLKAKLGDKIRLERFADDGHALFVDDPVRFNRVVDEFIQGLPK